MNYIFQRLVLNDYQWLRPSKGRLGPLGEGEYVQVNGFGHEDWNFNQTLAIGGYVYGYVYYNPAEKKQNSIFNIAFGIYKNKSWYVTGFYFNATYVDSAPYNIQVLKQKASDIKQLGSSLGKKWKLNDDKTLIKKISDSNQYLRWKVSSEDIIRLPQPIKIPTKLFDSKNFRIVKPTNLSKKQFDAIFKFATSNTEIQDIGNESEFPEGAEIERLHKDKERSTTLIALAKRNFIAKHGKLFCEICNFDFEKEYGEIGFNFIEAHHTIPLSSLNKKTKTKESELAMVCSNCHRMLHRKRPWLTMDSLRKLIPSLQRKHKV